MLFCGRCGAKVDSSAPPKPPTDLSFHPDLFQVGIILSGLVMIASTFLPYTTSSRRGPLSLLSEHTLWLGAFYIAVAVLSILTAVMDKRLPPLVLSGCAFLLCLYMFFQTTFQSYWAALTFRSLSKESGFYLILLSSTAMMLLSLLGFLFPKQSK